MPLDPLRLFGGRPRPPRGSPPIRIIVGALDEGATFARDFERDRFAGRWTPMNRMLISNASQETLEVKLDGGIRARVLPQSDELIEGGDVAFRAFTLTASGELSDGEVEINVQRTPR